MQLEFITPAGNSTSASSENLSNHSQSSALSLLLEQAAASGYRFITPTPLTHRTVLQNRRAAMSKTLRDIFGWNLPFAAENIALPLRELMHAAGILAASDGLFKTTIRIATLEDVLFLHSGYPTTQEDAVFFGPDTYRFIRFIRQSLEQTLPSVPVRRILDIGCGSGAGGIMSARILAKCSPANAAALQVVMNDINPHALALTAINAQAAQVSVEVVLGDALAAVAGEFDLIVCNPPYLDDDEGRAYRHGGAGLGRALGVRMAEQALSHLAPGGRLLLYTGVAIVEGNDAFIAEIGPLLAAGKYDWAYDEIDPDIFGEELTRPQYHCAERIAAVGLTVIRRVDLIA